VLAVSVPHLSLGPLQLIASLRKQDEKNKLVTTPAYMLGPGIKDIAVGIEKLVDKIMDMAINA